MATIVHLDAYRSSQKGKALVPTKQNVFFRLVEAGPQQSHYIETDRDHRYIYARHLVPNAPAVRLPSETRIEPVPHTNVIGTVRGMHVWYCGRCGYTFGRIIRETRVLPGGYLQEVTVETDHGEIVWGTLDTVLFCG